MNLIGREIDRYKIVEAVGEGGMASVYKGFDSRLNREVAIKIIRTNFSSKEIFLKRFDREARLSAQLSHPNIVQILDFGEFESFPYIVMQYMSGGTLKSKIGTPVDYTDAIKLIIPVAQALNYAHQRGIIHRDVKPSNIIFDENQNPLLSDFGIARSIDGEDVSGITATGMGIGTPEYMAPEQWQGKAVSQSDIYSLGVILFELITGNKPYTADTPAAIIIKQFNEPIPSPRTYIRNLPQTVEKVILKALAKKVEDRYQSTEDFIKDLQSISDKSFVDTYKSLNSNDDLAIQLSKKRRYIKWLLASLTLLIISSVFYFFKDLIDNTFNWFILNPSIWLNVIAFLVIINVIVLPYLFLRNKKSKKTEIRSDNHYTLSPLPTIKKISDSQATGTMTVNVMASLSSDRQRKILQLINREQELRLKDRLVYFQGGIRIILHGFGRFGSTSILNQIIEQSKIDLAKECEKSIASSVLAVRIAFSDSLDRDSAFTAVIRELRIEATRGKYGSSFKSKINKLYSRQNIEVSESTTGNSFSIKAAPVPGIETSFSKNSGRSYKLNTTNITDSELMDAVTRILDRSERDLGLLERTIDRLLNNTNFPARVIVIIEKVSDENILLELRRMRLFEDSRISIFAIVQQEDLLSWSSEVINKVDRSGFKFHYVPCVWEEENQLICKMLQEAYGSNINSEEVEDFLYHIAFITKGAPGDVVREIVDHKYVTFSNGIPELALKDIRARDREVIRCNSIREKILAKNWQKILNQGFSGSEQYDQARIGIYEIVDWMYRNVQFTFEELLNAADGARVPVSSSKYIREKSIRVLISIMRKHKLINSMGKGTFRVRPIFKITSENLFMKTDPKILDTIT